MTWVDRPTHDVLSLATSPWVLLVVLVLTAVDALVPPLPSEALVISLAALGAAGHGPEPWLLVLVTAAGAFAGDRTAYALGCRVPPERVPLLRGPRGRASLARVRDLLARRGAIVLLSARYVPVGRVAVTFGAGLTGYPARRFTPLAALATLLWATWTVGLGLATGSLLADRPLLSVLVGIAVGGAVGLLVDLGVRLARWRAGRAAAGASGDVSGAVADGPVAEVAVSRSGR